MNNIEIERFFTEEQRIFVWDYVCAHMDYTDRSPDEVIEQDYAADRNHYLQIMAAWHGIHFCNVCGKPNKEDKLVFQENIEGKGVNLCGLCAVEYQARWRPENSPVEPNVLRFIFLKNLHSKSI